MLVSAEISNNYLHANFISSLSNYSAMSLKNHQLNNVTIVTDSVQKFENFSAILEFQKASFIELSGTQYYT